MKISADDRLDRQRFASFKKLIQQKVTASGQQSAATTINLIEQLLLALEIIADQRLVNARPLGDDVQRRVQPVARKGLRRRFQQRLASFGGVFS